MRHRLAALRIQGPDVGRLVRRGALDLPSGRVSIDEVSVPRAGQRFAFIMDTAPCDAAVGLAERADMVVCESTFLDADAHLARRYRHLTARDAAWIASEARARSLVLSHFSQRYVDDRAFEEEAAAVFPDVVVARDLMTVAVPAALGPVRRGRLLTRPGGGQDLGLCQLEPTRADDDRRGRSKRVRNRQWPARTTRVRHRDPCVGRGVRRRPRLQDQEAGAHGLPRLLDAARRARPICHREVELNRRLAPDVYLGVVDVVGPDGEPCDHVVAMRRMPDERRLSTLVARGSGDAIDDGHASPGRWRRSTPRPHAGRAIDAAATPDAVRRLWVGQLRRDDGVHARGSSRRRRSGWSRAWRSPTSTGGSALFEERIARGRIVDGHGDLLAADIFCLDDGPRILDCLEFDDRLRFGDVLLDVAFLAMDLERLGRPELARTFLDAYREFSGRDPSRCRSSTTTSPTGRWCDPRSPASWPQNGRSRRPPPRPRRCSICAPATSTKAGCGSSSSAARPGTGKTTRGRRAGRGGSAGPSCAATRCARSRPGCRPSDRAVAGYGEGIYAPALTEATYAELLQPGRGGDVERGERGARRQLGFGAATGAGPLPGAGDEQRPGGALLRLPGRPGRRTPHAAPRPRCSTRPMPPSRSPSGCVPTSPRGRAPTSSTRVSRSTGRSGRRCAGSAEPARR